MHKATTMMIASALGLLLAGAPAQAEAPSQEPGMTDTLLGGPKVEKRAKGDQSRQGRHRAKRQARADRLFETLNVTAEQKAAIKQRAELMREQMRQIVGKKARPRNQAGNATGQRPARRGANLTDEQRTQMKSIREAFQKDVRVLLNADQQAAFDEMRSRRDKAGKRRGQRGMQGRRGGDRGAFRERLLERFDANGDGQLDETERAAAREAREARGGKRGKRGKRRGAGSTI
ncbi:MAG: Spy/CpxP family protein refolding chaperone [Planctomycetota bacterium]|jgi:hypothetical protein